MSIAFSRVALRDPGARAYGVLRLGFIVAPILFGLDKFFNVMTEWTQYLAPWLNDIVPGTAQQFMYAVGAIEIVAGLLVAFAPRLGGYVVAAWLGAIIVNLLTAGEPGYYDIALRDFGLLLGAFALAQLATAFETRRGVTAEATLQQAA